MVQLENSLVPVFTWYNYTDQELFFSESPNSLEMAMTISHPFNSYTCTREKKEVL